MAKKGLDRLAAIRSKLENTDLGGGNSQGFWSPKEGKTIVRILPEVHDMEFFFQEVGKHEFPPEGKTRVYCPKFTSADELPCPVCELINDLYRSGSPSNKKLAKSLRLRKMYWMNVIVRGKKGEEDSGPFIYTPGVTVMNAISQIIGDPDYGDVTDAEEGFDISIERKGKGLDTEYNVLPRRQPSPLGTPDEMEEWLENAANLAYVELTEDPDEDKELIGDSKVFLLPYSRIESEFDLSGDSVLQPEEEEDDEEVEERYKVTSKKLKGKSSVAAKKKVVEDDEDDEDDDEDDEDDDEEVEEPKTEVRRRVARRSKR